MASVRLSFTRYHLKNPFNATNVMQPKLTIIIQRWYQHLLVLAVLLSALPTGALAQQVNTGNFHVASGGTVVFFGNFTNTSTGTVTNSGTIYVLQNLTNDGSYTSSGTATDRFEGTDAQTVDGTTLLTLQNVLLNNANGLTVDNEVRVSGGFTFSNGKVTTNRATPADLLHFLAGSSYLNEADARHVDGYVSKTGNTMFIFPIGNGTTLRPAGISNLTNVTDQVTAAYYSVNPNSATLPTGAPFPTASVNLGTGVAEVSTVEYWDVNSTASASLTLTWNATSNLAALTPSTASLTIVGWNAATSKWEKINTASVTGTLTVGTITSVPFVANTYSVFTLGEAGVNLIVDVFLQGAAVSSTPGVMRNSLQTYGVIFSEPDILPTTSPYPESPATYALINNPAGPAGALVDWVEVQIRSVANPNTILQRRSLLLQTDGDVVDVDGSVPLFNPQGVPVYVVLRHRSHVPVVSNSITAFNGTVTYDFTTAVTQAYEFDPPGDPNQLVQVNSKWSMWATDSFNDGFLDANDRSAVVLAIAIGIFGQYVPTDANMDGFVDANDRSLTILNISLGAFSSLVSAGYIYP